MSIKSFLKPVYCFQAAAIVGVMAGMTLPAQADNWRGWNVHPPGYPNSVALDSFVKEVTENTDGRIKAKIFHNGVLGDQPDAIEQTRSGALNFANFNMGPMGPIVPETDVLSLPFLFKDIDAMHKVMDGEIGQRFADALEKKNLVALSWFDSGARSVYNTRRPINEPEDMQGLKVRVMNNDLYVEMIDALGGNATPMAYGEVYQSLKTGVLDGAENNFPSYESSGHDEIAKYYSETEHLILPECLCIAKRSWDKLSDQDQEIVRQAAVDAATLQRKLWAEGSKKSREDVLAAGVKINEVDKPAFQAKMEPIYAAFVKKHPDLEPLLNDIRNAQ
ncbi:TRAP transporter substrate-binding protein [Kushneria marisflavi]|uniref:C4-dicarboxylate ABC transporter n=1 Tax=Kushneria marisflavi TaxID=157779 RepID=A0A240UTE2_9GAMM|nr:C4-dicarboxylate ABC transporter [Kushneria marisflavi]RKD76779.1 tripartite ATP-independent transporter DctP family solute receptor [Kushneria marisflavi]